MTINDLLSTARQRLERVRPAEALDAVRQGAVLIDIRSEVQRQADGVIPGARFYPRNVLEWRIDPASGYADPSLEGDLGKRLIVVCNEGYQSSLVAATLKDLGFTNATDLVGGFQAWRAAGLPVQLSPDQPTPQAQPRIPVPSDVRNQRAAAVRCAHLARPLNDDPGERLGGA